MREAMHKSFILIHPFSRTTFNFFANLAKISLTIESSIQNTPRHNLTPCKIQQYTVQHLATPLQLETLSNYNTINKSNYDTRNKTINDNWKII